MYQRKPNFIRPLLLVLMLVIGPVHAQNVLTCAVMDMVMHSDCFCDGDKRDKACMDSSFDIAADSDDAPCCEHSVNLTSDEDARRANPIVKPTGVHADVDQSQTIVASFDVIESRRALAIPRVIQSVPTPSRSSSDIYLITQRLRI